MDEREKLALLNEERKKRQLAILKASNQLLEETKERAMKQTSDDIARSELAQQFDKAIEENKMKSVMQLGATPKDIETAEYREVSPEWVEKYKKRLEKRGLTEEQVQRKDEATVSIGNNGDANVTPRRRRRGSKKDVSEIERLDNEEELMKLTMAKDDKAIEKNIERNKQFENQMLHTEVNKVEQAKKNVEDGINEKKIETVHPSEQKPVEVTVKTEEEKPQPNNALPKKKKKTQNETVVYDFDFSSVPSYVQYDVIPLPSNGQCYPKSSPLRCGRVPVAYLTASDENIIASPNAYRDGKILDIILSRKILDKRIDINTLCSGDKDAIILWLRGTSYGDDFPVSTTDPKTGKQYNVTIKLSDFKYFDFNLDGDDDGLFDYETENGDLIKFKFFTSRDEENFKRRLTSQVTDINKLDIIKNINEITKSLNRVELSDDEREMVNEDINEMKEIIGVEITDSEDEIYPNTITEQMIMHTVSVNGNEDRQFIKNYIENIRTKTSLNYRNYFIDNKPGVDFSFVVNIPESEGGGSFNSFLRLDDTVFLNF